MNSNDVNKLGETAAEIYDIIWKKEYTNTHMCTHTVEVFKILIILQNLMFAC